jgi:hypothetical protein
MSPRLRFVVLRLGGVLLVVLGALHLAVTPFIARLVREAAPSASDWLTPPMLLNHVVVGILLLPLGVLTAYAARHASAGVAWAQTVTRVNALAIALLPPTLFLVMGRRYFVAVPFLVATGIVCLAAIVLLLAAFSAPPTPSQKR